MPSPTPIPPSNSSNSRPSSPSGGSGQYGSPNNITIPSIQQIPSHVPIGYSNSPRIEPLYLSNRPELQSRNSFNNDELPSNAVINIDDLTEEQKQAIVKKHLLSAEDQRIVSSSPGTSNNFPNQGDFEEGEGEEEEFPIPYSTTGADTTYAIYKSIAKSSQPLRRSKSLMSVDRNSTRRVTPSGFDSTEEVDEDDGMGVREILEPGGFRRDFVLRNNFESNNGNGGGSRFTKSFIDFLSLYGHFGGEDLEEDSIESDQDDQDDELENGSEDNFIPEYTNGKRSTLTLADSKALNRARIAQGVISERSPLVRKITGTQSKVDGNRLRSKSRNRSSGVGEHGDATITQAVMMLLKSFVGTGVLFLGKAFYNGGMIFSTVVLLFIALISLYSFLLLVRTRLVVHGSFGDIGGILYGKYMRWMILFSIVLSQIGFVAAYTIFVAQNLQAFVMAVTQCKTLVPLFYLIAVQLVIFLPLAMIRNIQKLSGTALIADAFILFGLVYIFSTEIGVLSTNGLADVQAFNSKDFPLLIGTAVFAFEGIGLVIPITESMKDPHQFPKVLTAVMFGVSFLFAGAGVLAYAAYGSAIQTVVFVNLPQTDKFVNAAQFLYSLAILLSTPLQLFPAVRIMENGLFSRSGKYSTKVKWEKNGFRFLVVLGCIGIAWLGANDLDKFVSLIGSVACVPLCFCYPALLHYKACATTRKQKIADVALFIFGCLAAVYTTSQTIKLLTSGNSSGPPTFGNCPTPQY